MNKQFSTGFTIVELATVIAVLAILFGIVTIGYPVLQNRANSDQARSHALSVQKIAESYYEERGRYPETTAEFRELSTKLSTSITILTGSTTLSSTNGLSSIDYDYRTISGEASGVRIRYWDFTKSPSPGIATDIIYLGNANASSSEAGYASPSS